MGDSDDGCFKKAPLPSPPFFLLAVLLSSTLCLTFAPFSSFFFSSLVQRTNTLACHLLLTITLFHRAKALFFFLLYLLLILVRYGFSSIKTR